jgi:hypothetical protein
MIPCLPDRRAGLRIRHDGAGAAEGAIVPEVGGVASGGLHDPLGWGGEAESGVGEAGGANSDPMNTLRFRFCAFGSIL